MPGYYVHYASCYLRSLGNRSFVLGLEAPDMLKKHVKVYGVDGARTKYNSLRTNDMPEYDELLPRILQKETINSKDGLHYGVSSNPDVKTCWANLSVEQKKNPFYRGYVTHLLQDLAIYGRIDIDSKFQKVLEQHDANVDLDSIRKVEVKKLHDDWDKTNALVRDTYPEVVLSDEVKELGVVKYINEGDLVYVDWRVLKECIDYLRTFDTLNGDMDSIIETVTKYNI